MTVIELYTKNNYHHKDEWGLSTTIDYNKISSILSTITNENFFVS